MIQNIISIVLSFALSLCLLSSHALVSEFAFYVAVVMNALAWVSVLCGLVKDEAAKRVRDSILIMLPSTLFSIYAAIFSGHPMLAASTTIVSFFIVCRAFAKELA